MDYAKYNDIRPLLPSEVPSAIQSLLANEMLRSVFESLGTGISWSDIEATLRGVDSIEAFKQRFSGNLVKFIMAKTCHSVAPLHGMKHIDLSGAYTYISNHRDIILDSAFINVLLADQGAKYPQIAIGDNLMILPWVETLVKLNGSFLVKRNLQGREVLLAARQLSEYMHDAIADGQAIWIAQREGRAKDSSDRTQPALLKMLAMGAGKKDIISSLSSLNIVPQTCSYEYDPCDYLKAREMQLKRDTDYHKSPAEDGLNMKMGVLGYKGRVHFTLGRPLTQLIKTIDWTSIKEADRVETIARLLDEEIYRGYTLYPGNYIAWDRLTGRDNHRTRYTAEDVATFDTYLQSRLSLIEMPAGVTPDIPYLTERILEMYANPAINHHSVAPADHP